MACDTCKKITTELEKVTEFLQSKEIKVICSVCEKRYNKLLVFYRKVAIKRLKRRMKKDSLTTKGE